MLSKLSPVHQSPNGIKFGTWRDISKARPSNSSHCSTLGHTRNLTKNYSQGVSLNLQGWLDSSANKNRLRRYLLISLIIFLYCTPSISRHPTNPKLNISGTKKFKTWRHHQVQRGPFLRIAPLSDKWATIARFAPPTEPSFPQWFIQTGNKKREIFGERDKCILGAVSHSHSLSRFPTETRWDESFNRKWAHESFGSGSGARLLGMNGGYYHGIPGTRRRLGLERPSYQPDSSPFRCISKKPGFRVGTWVCWVGA